MPDVSFEKELKMFDLDAVTITKDALKIAFRKKALAIHPDTKQTYVDKVTATEQFQAASNARDALLDALAQDRLPRPAKTQTSAPDPWMEHLKRQQDARHRPAWDEAQRTPPPPQPPAPWLYTPRDQYDYHHKRPMEWMLSIPLLGEILGFVVMIAVAFVMLAGFVFYMPVVAICDAVKSFGSPEAQRKFDQAFNAIFNPVVKLILAYAIGYFSGWFFFTKEADMRHLAIAVVWAAITLFALDEIYSLVRWHFVSKRIAEEMDVVIRG